MNTSTTKPNPAEDANLDARPVKDIIEPAKTVLGEVSVQTALDEMQARGIDSALVTNQRGELLGTEPKGGWFGARPKDRTGRSTSGKKQCLLLRRSDGCGG
jgi:hypothetical protein